MSNKYAQLNDEGEVIQVVVLNEEEVGDMATITQLTLGRLKKISDNIGIGYFFNTEVNDFVSPKPHLSWILNKSTLEWESPIGSPPELKENEIVTTDSGYIISGYSWNEDLYQSDNTKGWVLNIPEL